MRPAWRLAIRNLSERRSRTALLTATVALSAALIAAVSCAMDSVQASARRQVEQTVGLADLTLRPLGRGQSLDPALLDAVRSWDGVAAAVGVTTAAIQVGARLDTMTQADEGTFERRPRRYTFGAIAKGRTSFESCGATLAEGRWPAAADEIAVDANLTVWLSPAGRKAESPTALPSRNRGVREHLRGPHPVLPDSTSDPAEAERLNALVGVRVGDTIEIARRALPDINISAALADPAKAMEMARAAGFEMKPQDLLSVFQAPLKVRIVGVTYPPPFGGRPRVFVLPQAVGDIQGRSAGVSSIEITLREGQDPDEFLARRQRDLPHDAVMKTSAKVTSGLDQNIQASRLGLLLASVMAFLCAAFIITTAMTTGVTERQRELGMLRCIGASRRQLAEGQIAGGLCIGGLGALLGVPLGVALAALLVRYLQTQVEVSLHLPWWGVAEAAGGSLLSGIAGAAYPAWKASRVSVLEALAARASVPRRRGVLTLLAFGLALAATQLATVTLTTDGQWRFWLYVFLGMPSLFFGYFALSVPAMAAVRRAFAGAVSRLMGLPRDLLARTIDATPYRYGFTSGSMMMGMALMVAIWTQGSAIRRDWIGKLEFPDAFVTGLNIDEDARRIVDALPYVQSSVAITVHPVDTDSFGVQSIQRYRSTFMAFEPDAFFAMMRPVWVQGTEAEARRRLNEGGAVIVGREFQIARGLGVGDRIVCRDEGREIPFEIVGVVTSPGLEVVSQFFSIGEEMNDQSLHAVFGTRRDLKEKFGSDAIHLLQISFTPGTDDAAALREIREKLAGAGILEAGSGRKLKEQINEFIRGALFAMSCIAVTAMLISGFGVANLIVAGITARQFEFGVLRAIGAAPGLISRLVLAEAVLIGLTAAFLGTCMGLQGVYAVQRIDEKLFGLDLHLRPPPAPIVVGWAVVLVMTLGAAAPAVLSLGRRKPRELLGAVRG